MTYGAMLLAAVLGAGAPETPNQSLSITSVVESPASADRSAPPDVTIPVEAETTALQSFPPAQRVTPRSGGVRSALGRSAGSDSDTSKLSASRQRTTWWVTTAFGLIIVLSVMLAASKALKKMVPGLAANSASGPVHLLHRTFLAPKQSVCLLRCGTRLLLVGVTSERMETLAEITDPEEIDFIKGQCMQTSPRSASVAFKDALKQSEQRRQQPIRLEEADPAASASHEHLTEQLGRLRERILSFNSKAQP